MKEFLSQLDSPGSESIDGKIRAVGLPVQLINGGPVHTEVAGDEVFGDLYAHFPSGGLPGDDRDPLCIQESPVHIEYNTIQHFLLLLLKVLRPHHYDIKEMPQQGSFFSKNAVILSKPQRK